MENVFLHLLNMSLTAGLLVVVVMVLRLAFHKAPRWIHCLLWALVAVRLLCPIRFESHLSLMPDTEAAISAVQDAVTETPAPDQSVVTPPDTNHSVIDTPTTNDPVVVPPTTNDPVVVPPATDTPVVTPLPNQPITPESSVSAATPEASVDPWQVAVSVATYVWLAGVALLAVYAVITTLRLHRQVREAARLTDRVWCCDHLRSPFILGVFRPRIYIPSDLNPTARASVLAHEQAHLHRRDHWWKPLGFILLTVYWFNPLMWVAYILLCRDIESACDERVVRDMTAADRKAYSEALLACSAPRRLVSACPLAFGETSVKSRIKSVLSYKKPTIWIIVAALLISTVAGVCLLTDPKSDQPAKEDDPKTSVSDEEENPTEDPESVTIPVDLTHALKMYADGAVTEMFGASAEDVYENAMGDHALITCLDSRAALDSFLTTYVSEGKISEFELFDDAFFADNVLLMSYHVTTSGMITPEVVSYTYSDDRVVLTVDFVEYIPASWLTMDIGPWWMFSGIKRADLEGVVTLQARRLKEVLRYSHWVTYSHPIEVGDTEPAETSFSLGESEETFRQLVDSVRWYGADIMVDTAFTALGYFTFDGEKRYYVSPDGKSLYDGEQIADLSDEQKLEHAFGEGTPVDAATTSVTGMMVEWNQQEQYMVFDVIKGDTKLGKRVRAYAALMPAGGMPAVGYPVTVYYDGWYRSEGEYSVIYAIYKESVDSDMLGGPEDDPPTTGTTTTPSTKPTTTPTTTIPSTPSQPKIPEVGLTYVIRTSFGSSDEGKEFFGTSSVKRFDSRAEFETFLTTYQKTERNYNRWEISDFDQFDIDFFTDNVLLMTRYTLGSGSITPQIGGYTYSEDGKTLLVGVDELHPSMGTDDMAFWLLFSGIKKVDLQGVTEWKAYQRKEIPTDSYMAAFTTLTAQPEIGVEKWRAWFPHIGGHSYGWDWYLMLSRMDEAGRWVSASSMGGTYQYMGVFQKNGHIHYVSSDYTVLLRDDGKMIRLNQNEINLLQCMYILRAEDDPNTYFIQSTHPGMDPEYLSTPRVINSPELRAIAERQSWVKNTSTHTFEAIFIVDGKIYYVDWDKEKIIYEDQDTSKVLFLTKEEKEYLATLICDPTLTCNAQIKGAVVSCAPQLDYLIMRTEAGKEIQVSLLYWEDKAFDIGTQITVGYDGYTKEGTYPTIYARSIVKQTWVNF